MVNGDNLTGTLNATLAKVELVDPSKVTATITYDTGGLNPQAVSRENLVVGNRVRVALHYDVEPMLPFLEPLLSGMSVDTEAVRTITRVGSDPFPEPLNLPPIPDFVDPPICTDLASCTTCTEGLSCTFDGSPSYDLDGDIVTRAWDFGDPPPGYGLTATHIYMDNGTYAVTLTLTDDDGATASVSHDVMILDQSPTAAFTWAPEPQNEDSPVDFTDTSTSYPDALVKWEWDFDGLSTSTEQNPPFTFMEDGVYSVCLTVTDDDGSTDTACHSVTVEDLGLTADFTWSPNPQYEGSPVAFTDISSSYPDGITSWAWGFGGQGTSTEQNPPFTFMDDRDHWVCLTVTDDDGRTDTACHYVTVADLGPTADFTWSPDRPDEGSPVAFTDGSTSDPDGIKSWAWDFGGLGTSTEQNPPFTFMKDGDHQVCLTVTDDDDSTDTACRLVTVNDVLANLIVEQVALTPGNSLLTYAPLTFDVTVKNIGGPVNAPFWVDLYLYPADPIPVPPSDPTTSDAWATVGALAPGQSETLSLSVSTGVSTTGDYLAYVVADSGDKVVETDETDNLGKSATFKVSLGIEPEPEPPTSIDPNAGAISGSTWLFWAGDIAPQGRVRIFCVDVSTGLLVAETISDLDGNYLIEGLATGTYDVTGELTIGDVLFAAALPGISVTSPATTSLDDPLTLYP